MSRFSGQFLVPHAAGLVIFTAGALKVADWASGAPAHGAYAIIPAVLQLPVALTELTLAGWLCSGRLRRLIAPLTGLLFLMLTPFAGAALVNGEHSCGCFGALAVPPVVSLLLDAGFAMALLLPRLSGPAPDQSPGGWRYRIHECCAATALAATLLWTGWIIPRAAEAHSLTTANTQLLTPSEWVGKPFPLRTDLDGAIGQGNQTVLLFHRSCPACRQAIDRLSRSKDSQSTERIAAIEIPDSHVAASERFSLPNGWPRTRLDTSVRWLVETPILVEIDNGVVRAVRERSELIE